MADLGERKEEDKGDLAEELSLSQEDIQRLDRAHDDIDEIAEKAKASEKAIMPPTSPKSPARAKKSAQRRLNRKKRLLRLQNRKKILKQP